jgi:hypothetical protein
MDCENVGWFYPGQNVVKWPALVEVVVMRLSTRIQARYLLNRTNTTLAPQERFCSTDSFGEGLDMLYEM